MGDYIEFQGFTGTVKEIQIFNTILNTVDNKWISIPNGGLSTGSINNYSKEDYRRIDWTIGISYGDNYNVAKDEILRIINSDERIVKHFVEDDREMRASLESKPENNIKSEVKKEEIIKKHRILNFLHRKKVEYENTIEQRQAPIQAPRSDKSPFVALGALSASSVDIIVRVWAPTSLYWNVYFDLNERFYNELPKVGINFPFPQMDVHLHK